MPDLEAKPIKQKTKAKMNKEGDNEPAITISSVQFRVPMPEVCLAVAKRRIKPITEKSMAVEAMKTYFKAAITLALSLSVTIRMAD
jgi:hypothetical protein